MWAYLFLKENYSCSRARSRATSVRWNHFKLNAKIKIYIYRCFFEKNKVIDGWQALRTFLCLFSYILTSWSNNSAILLKLLLVSPISCIMECCVFIISDEQSLLESMVHFLLFCGLVLFESKSGLQFSFSDPSMATVVASLVSLFSWSLLLSQFFKNIESASVPCTV